MAIIELPIKRINVDPSVLPRCNDDDPLVGEYTELRRVGVEFPPVIVFEDADHVHWLADGVKRLAAEKAIGNKAIKCDKRSGDRAKATWFASGANREHGLRLTAKEKKQAVRNCLNNPSLQTKSDGAIAEKIGISLSSVQNYRKKLEKAKVIPPKETVDYKPRSDTGRARPPQTSGGHGKSTGRRSAAKTRTLKAKALKDELGDEVPEFLRPVVADTQDIKRHLTANAAIYEKYTKLKRLPSGAGQELDVRSIIDVGTEERTMIQDAMFYCRCPECWDKKQRLVKCICGGKGSTTSNKKDPDGKAPGWLTRAEYYETIGNRKG